MDKINTSITNSSLEQETKSGILLEEVGKFNVRISSPQGVVIVTDAPTHTREDAQRLPGDALLQIIKNIFNCTKMPYTVRGKTQDWAYSGIKNEDRKIELWEYSDTPQVVILSLEDDDYIELFLESGTFEQLEHMITQAQPKS